MRIPTRKDAEALGMSHVWDSLMPPAGRDNLVSPSAGRGVSDHDGMNKLERAFHTAAVAYFGESRVCREPIKLRLAGRTWYTPDFLIEFAGRLSVWEVKGFMRDDAAVKLKVAVSRFSWLSFVLVTRPKGRWECRHVGHGGISQHVWCPQWLF